MVIKRDGIKEEFNRNKIRDAVLKAFGVTQNSSKTIDEDIYRAVTEITNSVVETEDQSIEDIQDQIEELLMDLGYHDVAKKYILYRKEREDIRNHATRDIKFIHNFVKSDNTANATIDDNSNVGTKGIGVLNAEIHKADNKLTNTEWWESFVKKRDPNFNIKVMRNDFKTILYPHDSSSQVGEPYCMAASMYPFLLSGLEKLGGKSAVPKNLDSFCGIYVNLNFALASEIKGAVATPEFLMYMDYFCRKEWGNNYYLKPSVKITTDYCIKQKTIGSQIDQCFQQVTYSINQIAGARGMQSPFTNFSFFDKYFFEGMFGEFVFPDGTKPEWNSTNWLQKRYLHWLNQERLKCILTFPVCSYACLTDKEGNFKDLDTFNYICNEYAQGNSFFTYMSRSVDSLSSCCRLQNAVQENTFNTTNGQIGIMTGSKNVITLDLNRIIQDWQHTWSDYKDHIDVDTNRCCFPVDWITHKDFQEGIKKYIENILERVYLYQYAYNDLMHWCKDHHLYAAYDAGFINLDKQYLTIGINGLNQAAEYLGMECNNNIYYKTFCRLIFSTIKEQNKKHKTKTAQFNTEQVPAESASVKLYNRDKADGYWVPTDTNLYASYIFKPNDTHISILDKIILHSSEFAADELDGGSACHLNLSEHLSQKQYEYLLKFMAKVGCKYITFNIPNCECEECHFIAKQPFSKCPKCGSTHVSLWDRIIGYLTKISNWSAARRLEGSTRSRKNGLEINIELTQ
ncbi:MAG: anaerobic ribonucleoside-triphosphate reductase [Bacteriophage sp.]|nr:MAG: anaerobic ribonucleoside-triphosphate reductase [Bacteriophage sp.]